MKCMKYLTDTTGQIQHLEKDKKIFDVWFELKGDKSKKVNKVLWDYLEVVGILN